MSPLPHSRRPARTRAPAGSRWTRAARLCANLADGAPVLSGADIPQPWSRWRADAVRRNEPCHQQVTVVMAKPCDCQMSSPWEPAVVAGASTCAARRAPVQADIEALSARAISSVLTRTRPRRDWFRQLVFTPSTPMPWAVLIPQRARTYRQRSSSSGGVPHETAEMSSRLLKAFRIALKGRLPSSAFPFSHGRDAAQEGQLRVSVLAVLATNPKPAALDYQGVQQYRKSAR
jgi:hypothetical protein